MRQRWQRWLHLWLAMGLLTLTWAVVGARPAAAAPDEWPTSLHDISRSGSSADTTVGVSQAGQLAKLWSVGTGGAIASQPAIVGGVAYVGSWDGNEYALDVTTGAQKWKTFLGVTHGNAVCNPPDAGVSSAATVSNGIAYVGGGDAYWYALDAATGNVLWRIYTGDNSAVAGHYNWSSPLIYNGFAYVGVSSLGDCPLVQGELLKVDLSTHQVVATLKTVPDGEIGGGIWTSPALDPTTNRIFVTTGTESSSSQQWAQAVLAIDAGSLTVVDAYHLPESQAVADSDWTTSTALYTDANNRQLVLATNKNGFTYAWQRSGLAAGPVWRQQVALGNECAACGSSTVSSAAVGQGRLYQAGGTTAFNNAGYPGSVQAWDPATGAVIWRHPTTGPVIGALTYVNGMVIDGAGGTVEVLDASSGTRLYSYETTPTGWIYAAAAVAAGVIITGNTAGTVFAFALPAPVTPPPPDPNCPSGFTCQDIGSGMPPGSETVNNGNWQVTADGTGLSGSNDSFRLLAASAAGDVQVQARLTGQTGGGSGAQAGLIVRQRSDPGSPYYAILSTSGTSIAVQYRTGFNQPVIVSNTVTAAPPPLYLEIQKVGDRFEAATSPDGVNYTLVPGTSAQVVMPAATLAGLAVASESNGTPITANFSAVSVGAINNSLHASAPAGACPTNWQCQDVGNPLAAGGQSLSGSTWSLNGAGLGIGNRSDQFLYAWQAIGGDGTVSAHILSQGNTDPQAKAGVMMRLDTTPGATYYAASLTPTNGVQIEYRSTSGLPSKTLWSISGAPPAYLQVDRSGTTFTAYTSQDGVTWTAVAGSSAAIPNLGGTIMAGLAVTSHVSTATSTVAADGLATTNSAPPPPTVCPNGWTCQDVGSPAPLPAGSHYLINGTWTLQAGGTDIWSTSDQFHFAAENIAGDGSVSANITSQTDADPWAKAGIMLRASTDPSAPYYAILVTPHNGTVVQYRNAAGASTSQLAGVTSTAPSFVKVSRSGAVYTAFTSNDAVTWTAFPNSSVTIAALTGTILAGMAATSHSQFNLSTVSFKSFTFTPAAGGLPAPWSDSDIGSPTPAGSATSTNGVFTVHGGGNDIWGNLDQFNYVSQQLTGDGSIMARVTSQDNTSPWAKSGVMIKQNTTAGSPYALLAATPGNGLTFQYGYNTSVAGGTYTFPNVWLKLTRAGNVVTASSSADGVTWAAIGGATPGLSGSVTIGIFVTSHNAGTLNSSTFDQVAATSGTSGGSLPPPWTNADIGGAIPTGSTTFANNTFSVQGGGNDIWGTADQFQFVSQPLNGDGTIVARVTGQANTNPWAKSGVMIKQSTTAGSPYVLLGVTPANGYHMQYNFNSDQSGGTYTFPNAWVKLQRVGSTFTSYVSPDGSTWTKVGSATVAMAANALAGLFVTSHTASAINLSSFDNVTVTTSTGGLPAGWSNTDVGAPALSGTTSFASNVFTISGAGNDIWGSTDQFQYAYKALTGDGSMVARVTAQANTDQWAKSGIMIKQNTTDGSNYLLLAVTPGQGVHVQYNFANDQPGSPTATLPVWLKLTRSGTTITASQSPDGVTWTQIGAVVQITLADPITIGLFVTSHNAGALNTSTFDNVTATP